MSIRKCLTIRIISIASFDDILYDDACIHISSSNTFMQRAPLGFTTLICSSKCSCMLLWGAHLMVSRTFTELFSGTQCGQISAPVIDERKNICTFELAVYTLIVLAFCTDCSSIFFFLRWSWLNYIFYCILIQKL